METENPIRAIISPTSFEASTFPCPPPPAFYGCFTSIAFEIRAEIHAGPTADAEVFFMNVLYKRFGSIDLCHGCPS
jgi:hypothetical protein